MKLSYSCILITLHASGSIYGTSLVTEGPNEENASSAPHYRTLDKRSQGGEVNQLSEATARLNAAEQAGSKVVDGGEPSEEREEREEHYTAHSGKVSLHCH